MKKYVILLALICSACVTSRPLYTETNGEMVYEANCDGTAFSIGDCYKKASEDCPNGFDVKDKAADEWARSRKLVYVCKNSFGTTIQSMPTYQNDRQQTLYYKNSYNY